MSNDNTVVMSVRNAVEEYSYAKKNQTKKTRAWKFNKLKFFIEWCEEQGIGDNINNITASHVRRFLDHVSHRTSRKDAKKEISLFTLRGYQVALKGLLSWALEDEIITTNVSKRIELVKTEDKVIEIFTRQQINDLFEACKREYNDRLRARDRAILCLLLDTGIRVSELCGLTLAYIDTETFSPHIRVMGKGRKEREVGLGHKCSQLLRRYISRFRGKHEKEDHVFLNRNHEPMTPNGIEQMFIRLGSWARIKDVRCSAHTCRHTFAVNYLLATGDIYMLSRILGHESVEITEIYLKAVKKREVRQSSYSLIDNIDDK